ALLGRRLQVIGSTLRTRSSEEKACIAAGFAARFGPALARGEIRPVVDRVLPLEFAGDAHRAMKASEHFGQIVLRVAYRPRPPARRLAGPRTGARDPSLGSRSGRAASRSRSARIARAMRDAKRRCASALGCPSPGRFVFARTERSTETSAACAPK